MYNHINTRKIFNSQQDRKDPTVISTRTEDHSLGYTGCSLDDFNGVTGTKVASSKRDLHWFSKNGHTIISKMFSWTQSLAFVLHYIKVKYHCYSFSDN